MAPTTAVDSFSGVRAGSGLAGPGGTTIGADFFALGFAGAGGSGADGALGRAARGLTETDGAGEEVAGLGTGAEGLGLGAGSAAVFALADVNGADFFMFAAG